MNRNISATLATVVPGAAGKVAPRGSDEPTAIIERQISHWPQLNVSTPPPSPSNGTRMVSFMPLSRCAPVRGPLPRVCRQSVVTTSRPRLPRNVPRNPGIACYRSDPDRVAVDQSSAAAVLLLFGDHEAERREQPGLRQSQHAGPGCRAVGLAGPGELLPVDRADGGP